MIFLPICREIFINDTESKIAAIINGYTGNKRECAERLVVFATEQGLTLERILRMLSTRLRKDESMNHEITCDVETVVEVVAEVAKNRRDCTVDLKGVASSPTEEQEQPTRWLDWHRRWFGR